MPMFNRKSVPQARPQKRVKFLVAIAGGSMPEYGLGEIDFLPGRLATINAELADKWIVAGICEPAEQVSQSAANGILPV